MMKTLSLFPRKTAQPPLVGKTARTCTSITVLFTPAQTVTIQSRKTSGVVVRRGGVPEQGATFSQISAAGRSPYHEILRDACLHVFSGDCICALRQPLRMKK